MPQCVAGPNETPCGNARPGPKTVDQCARCWINLQSGSTPVPPIVRHPPVRLNCVHRSPSRLRKIKSDGTTADTGCGCVPVYSCAIHGECTLSPHCPTVASCMSKNRSSDCPDYLPRKTTEETKAMSWQYGVTTIPARMSDGSAKRTLDSLARAGFDRPHLFVDGIVPDDAWGWVSKYEVNQRSCPVKTAGNWVLSLAELWMRNSRADRYAIFQDDFVTYSGLREYLDYCSYPAKGYWNLYTFPRNQLLAPKTESGGTKDGWFLANQLGKGAVALVFDGPAVRTLLGQEYLVDRFLSVETDSRSRGGRRCDRSIDGGIVEAMKRKGYQEWCHSPSLVQHTGLVSSMGNHNQALAESFRGEGYDARGMINKT